MKIAIIRQKYVPYGGAEKFSEDLIIQLADSGNEVHIFASEWTQINRKNIHFHKIPVWRFNSLARFLSFAFTVKKILKQESFDFIQSHERTLYQDIYRAGDGCHKEWLVKRKQFVSPLKNLAITINPFHRVVLAIEKFVFSPGNYKKIIAISEMVKHDIQRHYLVPDENIIVIYNGVSLEKFHPSNKALHRKTIRKWINIPEDAPLVLTVGSGFQRKGLKGLVQSLEHLKNDTWHLLAIGRGNWNRYRTFAPKAIWERMVHLPEVKDIEKYYAAADVFVLPSIYEPFGNANLEALATGLPIVVSRNSGAAELVTHKENGLILQNPGNPREIAMNLNFLNDPDIREGIGRRARMLAKEFSQEKNTREMLNLYKSLFEFD